MILRLLVIFVLNGKESFTSENSFFGGRGEGEVQKRHKEEFLVSALSALVVYVDKPNFLGFLTKTGLLH